MNEAELVECCKRKDMTAQNELYQRYAGEMFALCIRYSGNRDFAKDLLHDGFLKAFTSLDKFFYRGEGSLKAWLSRIMVNTALEAIRKQTQHIELDIETAPEIADPEYEDDDKIVKNIPQYNPQIQISEKSQTKRLEIADSRKTKRPITDKRTTPNKRHSNAIITL